MPPSTTRAEPVMNEDSSDARNSAARAISSGRPSRPMGMCTSRRCRRTGSASSSASRGVSIGPGHSGVGPDARPGVLDGQLTGEGEDAPLRRRVGHLRRRRPHQGHERGHVHDGAAARVDHGRDRRPAAEPHPLQVDLHHSVPRRRGRVEHAAVVAGKDPGVVEQDVQATEGVHGRTHHVGHLTLVGHVHRRRPWPDRRRSVMVAAVSPGGVGHDVGHHDGGSLRRRTVRPPPDRCRCPPP